MQHIFRAEVVEPEFGSSASMEFEVEDNEVSNVEDTSMYETNYYFWNHFSPRELNLKGMSLREAFLISSSKFDDDDDK